MAEFTAADVKRLRDETGAGMMDSKRALEEADGDFEKAKQVLRNKGLAKADERTSRNNDQGAVALATADGVAALVELKAETDFSAKADDFVTLTQDLADAVLEGGESAVANMADRIEALSLLKKENIALGRIARIEAGSGSLIDTYLHTQDGRGTNGVIVEARGIDAETAHQVALHIGFAKPLGLTRDEVPAADVDKARAQFEEVTRAEGKPEQAIAKIIEGRLNAWFGDRVLLDQGLLGEKSPTIREFIDNGEIVRFAQAYIGG